MWRSSSPSRRTRLPRTGAGWCATWGRLRGGGHRPSSTSAAEPAGPSEPPVIGCGPRGHRAGADAAAVEDVLDPGGEGLVGGQAITDLLPPPQLGEGSPRMPTAVSACSAVTTSGGASRTDRSPQVSTRSPRRKHACSRATARSWSGRSRPIIRPRPRTWVSRARDLQLGDGREQVGADLRGVVGQLGLHEVEVARAAAHATGLPPKVEPWPPGSQSMISERAMMPASGGRSPAPCRCT